TPLLEWGVLDSMSMLELLAHIEPDLGIPVPDDQVRPEHFLTPTDAPALERQFDGIEVPTPFVGAEQDAILPRRANEEAAAHVPGSRVAWLARCGHLAHMDRSQELLTVIRSFLASVPALERA
ncbi:MAG: hypothetical protein AAF602_33220, partial [Myxococcota bacterium]